MRTNLYLCVMTMALAGAVSTACGGADDLQAKEDRDRIPIGSASQEQTSYSGKFLDWSGQIEVYVKDCGWSTTPSHTPQKVCTMEDSYVLIGGGAEVPNGAQALLYESYPDGQNWIAKSKDHGYSSLHQVHAWAIGMRIIGMDPWTLRTYYMCYAQHAESGQWITAVAHPADPDCQVVGGGARVQNVGNGQLLFGSYPDGFRADPDGVMVTPTEWVAQSKDHMYAQSSTLTAYAIGIKNVVIPALGSTIQVYYTNALASAATGWVTASVQTNYQNEWAWVPASVGGRGENWTAGRLLTKLVPYVENGVPGALAQTKDHGYADSSNTRAYIVSMRKY